jgi:hypothetical protein
MTTRSRPLGWLLGLALLAGLVLIGYGPIAQLPNYHRFADGRAWGQIPHALNVLSNLPFALAGVWGLIKIKRSFLGVPSAGAWLVFAVALIGTAVGSSFYHLQPNDTRLVFDRLPIAWGCAAVLCAFLAERVHPLWSHVGVLLVILVSASVSVIVWWYTNATGAGDLRAYLFVQFLPLLLIPAGLILGLRRHAAGVSWQLWFAALVCYVLAKGCELWDAPIMHDLQIVSGHTLKHLLAALAAGLLLTGVGYQGESLQKTG